MNNNIQSSTSLAIIGILLTVGGAIGTWALMAVISSLIEVQWDFKQLFEQYKTATDQPGTFSKFHNHSVSMSILPFLFVGLISLLLRHFNKE